MSWLEGPSGIVVAAVLSMGLLYLVVQLVQWHFRVALRLRLLEVKDAQFAEQLASLRPARSLHDELSQLLGKTINSRLDALAADELTLLDQAIRQRLPELVAPVLQNASPRFSAAFAAAVEERALAHLPEALAAAGPRIGAALEQRLQTALADPEKAWERIDDRLGRRLVALAETLPAEATARLDARAGAALLARAEEMLASPDDFADLFERIDAALQEQILGTVEEPPEECVQAIAARTAAGMAARVADIFDNPGEHDELFERLDEKLGDRVVELAGDPDDETAGKLEDRICAGLLARLDHICDNPGEHESLYESIDEKLGERMLELAGDPDDETARKLEERICADLVDEVNHICDNPGEHTELYESIDEKLGGRILELATDPPPEVGQRLAERLEAGLLAEVDHLFEHRDEQEELFADLDEKLGGHLRRRLRDELSGGRGGRVDAALDELLRAHARARLEAADLTELDRLLDQRLAALAANAPETAARIDERLREELAARAANRAGGSNPGPGRPLAQSVEEWVGAALEQARPALQHALESWLGRAASAEGGTEAGKGP